MSNNVNHPPHYTRGGIETIDFIEAKELSWCLGNVVKYLSRAGYKGDKLEDLEKAAWYLRREIKRLGESVGDDESEAITRLDEARKEIEQWKTANAILQGEIVERVRERDNAIKYCEIRTKELQQSVDRLDGALRRRDEQIAELTQQFEVERKQADEWNAIACRLKDACDEARKQVVELTKQLVDAGLIQATEAQ